MNYKQYLLGATTAFAMMMSIAPANAEGYDVSTIEANAALSARVPTSIRDAKTLVIGSDNAYAPWEYLAGEDGQTPEGIDVDLAKAVAATLGLELDFQTSAFDAIIPSLGAKYDLGWSALSITPERMKTVNFVTYAESGSRWAVQKGNPKNFDPSQLCGHLIALQSGTWHLDRVQEESDACIAAGKPAVEILPFKVQTEAFTRVAVGGADATVTGDATTGYAAKQSRGTLETIAAVGDELGSTGQVGIAVLKTDMVLTQLLADTLNELIHNGTYGKVYAHWGVESLGVEKSEIKTGAAN